MIRLALLLLCFCPPLHAAPRPGFAPEIGTRLATGSTFTDASGRRLTLGKALDGHPALLILGYHTCPNLCGVVQNRVAAALTETGLQGRDHRVLFVSVSQSERPADAEAARRQLAQAVPEADLSAWRFLTGPGAAVAQRLGIELSPRARSDEIVHPVSIFVLTPDGRLAQALPVATFRPEDLRLALVDASDGRLGGLAERLYLLCAGYDATQGQYTPMVFGLLRVGGLATLALLAAGLGLLAWRRR